MAETNYLTLNVKFNGEVIVIDTLGSNATISDLKDTLYARTRVIQETQKLFGLRCKNNKPVEDPTLLSDLLLKPNSKLMLIGSTREAIDDVNRITEVIAPEATNDVQFQPQEIKLCYLPEHIEKVKRRSKAYKPRMLAEPRSGKRLLVLDIDYTIFDHLTPAQSIQLLARPYLHDFLRRAHHSYDIAIWSATSMTWILAKLTQLGVIPANAAELLRRCQTHGNELPSDQSSTVEQPFSTDPHPMFRVSFILDSSDMISVYFPEHGVKEVKPLSVIWDNHPQWGPHNTIMFDDIRRNFVMNPQTGLRIRPFRDAHANREKDRELRGLAHYLELIAKYESDFTTLNHNHWERYITESKRREKKKRHSDHPSGNQDMMPTVGDDETIEVGSTDEGDCQVPPTDDCGT